MFILQCIYCPRLLSAIILIFFKVLLTCTFGLLKIQFYLFPCNLCSFWDQPHMIMCIDKHIRIFYNVNDLCSRLRSNFYVSTVLSNHCRQDVFFYWRNTQILIHIFICKSFLHYGKNGDLNKPFK